MFVPPRVNRGLSPAAADTNPGENTKRGQWTRAGEWASASNLGAVGKRFNAFVLDADFDAIIVRLQLNVEL